MSSTLFGDQEHWEARAREARETAAKITDPTARQAMLNIATNYDTIAKRAEARELGIVSPRHKEQPDA